MNYYEPRPIILSSKTLLAYQFLSGFITFESDDRNGVGGAILEPAADSNTANLLFFEDTSKIIDGIIKPLTPYEFYLNQPINYTVQFEDAAGIKKRKVKTSSSQGHQQPVDPLLYLARPFILKDESINGEQAFIYGFLMDTHYDDVIQFDGDGAIIVELGRNELEKTQIYLFEINETIDSLEVYLSDNPNSPINSFNYDDANEITYQPQTEGEKPIPCSV